MVPASSRAVVGRGISHNLFLGGSCGKTLPKPVELTRAASEDQGSLMTFDDVVLGQNYPARVVKIVSFGAFVSFNAQKDALVHISEIADAFINDIHEYLSVGDEIVVRIINKDPNSGNIAASIKQSGVPITGKYSDDGGVLGYQDLDDSDNALGLD